MAVCEWIKYVTVLLTVLVYVCADDEKLTVSSEHQIENGHVDKRSAEHNNFWKRDTEKSLETFWKRAADEPYPDSELYGSSDDVEKRRVQFLGKRRQQFLGKRRQQFLGKRGDELETSEYLMDGDLDELEKRARQAFLGKRARQAFLGKRARQAFLGKRARQAFLGKRDDEGIEMTPDEVQSYLEELSDDDYEKRARQAFLGKRARQAFLGKRSDYYDSESPYGFKRVAYLGKRPRIAFLGKRSYDEMEEDEKRARQAFLGKRSADEQPQNSD